MPSAPPTQISRRQILGVGASLATLSAISACGPRLPSRPGYLKTDLGLPADFRAHLGAKNFAGGDNIGGIDLTFAEGAPLLAIAPGYVFAADNSLSGGYVTQVNYGTAVYEYAHQLEIFVKPRQRVERGMVIGREGKTGRNAGDRSHLQITVAGSAAFNHHRYRRFGPDYEEKNISSMMNYVLDPDRLTGHGVPLVDVPWDPDGDYDGPYLTFIDRQVKPALFRVADGTEITSGLAGYVRRRARAGALLNQAVNRLWQWRYGQKGTPPKSPVEIAALDDLFVKVRRAGNLIRLTSPYIVPGDEKALAAAVRTNPDHAKLLRQYYSDTKIAARVSSRRRVF